MQSLDNTREQLLEELEAMGQRISELEASESRLRGMEKALSESEQRFRLLYENAPLGYQSLDENGYFLEVNQAWLGMLGYSRDEVIGKWFGDFLAPGYQEHFKTNFPKFKAAGEIHWVEFEMLTKDGSQISVAFDGKIGRDEQGRFRQTHCILHDVTERKRAEESIDRANQDWERTFDAISDLVMVLDDRHKILRANKAMADALGLTERELTGKYCFELVHGEDAPPAFCPHAQLLADGAEHSAEVVEPRLGGTFDVRVSPITDQTGQVVGSVHVTRDITERKRVEEALQDSEERLRLTLEATQIGIWDWDVKTDQWYASPTYCTMLGYEPNRGLSDRTEWLERVHPDDLACVKKKIQDVLTGDSKEYQYEARLQHADGTYRWQHVRGVSVRRDENGKVTRMLGIRIDINERKRAEERIKQTEEFLNTVVDNLPIAVFAKSGQNGQFSLWNKASEALFGITKQQVIGKTDYDFFPKEQADFFWDKDKESFSSGEVIDIPEEPILTKNQGTRMLHTRKVPVYDKERQPFCLLGISQDITDRKRAENIMLARLRLVDYATSHSLDELLQATLDEVEILTDSLIGFYHFLEAGQRTLRLQSWSTRTLREMCTAEGQGLHYDIDEAGVWVDCVRERKPVIHNDYAALPHRRGMPPGHANVIRELVVPVFRGDRIVAVLGVGNKPVDYGTSDIETVSRLADLAWDIAERKLAVQALRAASLYNRSLIEASLDPLVTISAEGRITDVNKATERVTGYARKELIGTDFAEYFTNPQMARDGYVQAFRDGAVRDYELEIRHRNGELTSVTYNASVYYDHVGKVAGLFAGARDISRRKQAEEKNLWLAAIVESSDDAIIGKTLDGMITSWNKGAANIYGYPDTEVLGKPISLLAPPERHGEVSRLLERTKRGEHIEHYETVRLKKGGIEIEVSLTISPIRNAEGGIIGASTIARDITEQKSVQRQLLQAQKMESIGTLAGGIAHDFNNLLTVVLGFSELLLIGKDERDPARADLQKINEAARNGAELVQRILAFSRKTEINPRPLNLNHEIEQVKTLLVRTIPKMIDIELSLSGDLATVNADPVQIEQVLMNLAVNAKDAMPDGGTLTIETKNVALEEEYCRMHLGATPGDYVLLSVSDTGHGMDRETLNHIFEPFYTTKGVGRGTGLGLAMVYGIVKQHGGYTTCYSEPGVGTVFKIYLPVIPTEAKSETLTEKLILSHGTETILLVDDEVYVRELGKRFLEGSGYTVLTAATGKEALDLYKETRDQISLVILDLIMPEMGGKECLERLLKIEPRAKVLIASGYAAEGQTKDTIETGAKGFVAKPFAIRQLLQTVREVLDSD